MLEGLPIAKGSQVYSLLPCMANRHGLIAGATGTGKTVSLRVVAENFSSIGVPVFMADVKGDLSGMARPGQENRENQRACAKLGLAGFKFADYPTVFWDLYGEHGHPVRTTISDMGPLLISRLLNLNDTQGGVLNLVFKIADDNGMLLARPQGSRAPCSNMSATTRRSSKPSTAMSPQPASARSSVDCWSWKNRVATASSASLRSTLMI